VRPALPCAGLPLLRVGAAAPAVLFLVFLSLRSDLSFLSYFYLFLITFLFLILSSRKCREEVRV
jgi:hypothetical protein